MLNSGSELNSDLIFALFLLLLASPANNLLHLWVRNRRNLCQSILKEMCLDVSFVAFLEDLTPRVCFNL